MQLHNFGDWLFKTSELSALTEYDIETLKAALIRIKKTLVEIYHLKIHNLPEDFTENSYIIAANHSSDTDAPALISVYYDIMSKVVSYYPQLFVFAKKECFDVQNLMGAFNIDRKSADVLLQIMSMEKISPVNRQSASGGLDALLAAKRWHKTPPLPKHYLIFPQGTFYDITKENVSDINDGAFGLASLLEIPILPGYIEYAKENELNRIAFGEPMYIHFDKTMQKDEQMHEYKRIWLNEVIGAGEKLLALDGIPARQPRFSEEHQVRKRFR